MSKFTQMVYRGGLVLQKYSPEILAVVGTASVVTGVALTVKSTLKLEDALSPMKESVKMYEKAYEDGRSYICPETGEEKPFDETRLNMNKGLQYRKMIVECAKLYAAPIALTVAGISCLLGAQHILKTRNVALAAAFKGVSEAFSKYREEIVKEFGEEVDDKLYSGVDVVVDEKGKPTGEKMANGQHISPYARFFDESSRYWKKDNESNRFFLHAQERFANELLQLRGHMFLNEVYDMLGLERTKTGAQVGWFLDNGDNYITFGLYDRAKNNPEGRSFINGIERSVLLDFNVDGYILDLI